MTMKDLIADFPQNITEALEIASKASFANPANEIRNIVVCGMGGSGIGGRLVAGWMQDELSVPVISAQDYYAPNFVSQHTLVIASSYSGNTEETLASVLEAKEKGAHIIGVCSGGKIKDICDENGYDVVVVPGGNPPRSALAYSAIQLLNIFAQLGLTSVQGLADIKAGQELIVSSEAEVHQLGKEVAQFLHGNVGIIYGTTEYEPVLVRARQQFNENSKSLCWHHAIPEMNHNELVGWGGGDSRFATLFIDTDMNARNRKRMEITRDVISGKSSGQVHTLVAKGNSRIERSIYFINVLDWASWYLSELNGADAIEIEVIDYLKGSLAAFEG